VNILKSVIGSVGGLLILAAVFINSQAIAADVKIGFVDMQKVSSASTAVKKAQGILKQKADSLQGTLKKDEDDFIALKKTFDRKKSAWSDEEKKKKEMELQNKYQDISAKQEQSRQELKKLEAEHLGPIQKKIIEIVGSVAKDKGYSLILPRQVVIYSSEATDITDAVTTELNKTMK
jgi:outer membrane protein